MIGEFSPAHWVNDFTRLSGLASANALERDARWNSAVEPRTADGTSRLGAADDRVRDGT
jgi:hypothetical protein